MASRPDSDEYQSTTVYSVRGLSRLRSDGVTNPLRASIPAIVKFDTAESRHCVFNEITAVTLGLKLGIPIAAGVLTAVDAKLAFASLELGAPGVPLPTIAEGRYSRVAEIYPSEAAALAAFDILIGNTDRCGNLKASTLPHLTRFSGFDHSHALLGIEPSIGGSLRRLRAGDLVAHRHPFFGMISATALDYWTHRIAETPDVQIQECCEHGRRVNDVSLATQAALGRALIQRKKALPDLVRMHSAMICSG